MIERLRDFILIVMPEMQLAASAIVLLLFGAFGLSRITPRVFLATLLALTFTILLLPASGASPLVAFNGMFLSDGFTAFVKLLILSGGLIVLLASGEWLTANGGRPFEYLVLMLFSLLGMMLMVSAHDLLALYLGLELSSLALYVLAAFERDNAKSSEAGLKYFVLGSLSSGMLLFGMSLVYGLTGSTGFDDIAQQISLLGGEGDAATAPALVVGLVFIVVGLCFKVAAVPFHMWSPDVYEGAPTPVTAFFATAPKIAAFAVFIRVLMQPFAELVGSWQQLIVAASFASMLVGALAALRQTNIKRLLAYSSIGHAGFMLMGLAAGTGSGIQAMLIYLTLYLFMSAGAFAIVLLMRRDGVYVEQVSDLAGLARNRPWLAFALAACMFSMAGIPPLAGFFGKLYVVLAAIEAGLTPLAVAGLITSVISCYYYLRIVKFMYFDEPNAQFDPIPWASRLAVGFSAIVTLFFFLVPSPLVTLSKQAAVILLH